MAQEPRSPLPGVYPSHSQHSLPNTMIDRSSNCLNLNKRGISTESEEKRALMDFCYRYLGACNHVPIEETVNGIAQDEHHTRQEAKLLMSLLASPLRLDNNNNNNNNKIIKNKEKSSSNNGNGESGDEACSVPLMEPVSASESERSYASDSSSSLDHSRSPRGGAGATGSGATGAADSFSFTCPSLSLENNSNSSKRSATTTFSSASNNIDASTTSPATLLGRPLKVDDRDALRLSADAMARNISQSFQKAVGWRVQAWISTLSASLAVKAQEEEQDEEEQVEEEEDREMKMMKRLLSTSEARLILQLSTAGESIKVTTTRTSFQVGSSLLLTSSSSSTNKITDGESSLKKQRIGGYEYHHDDHQHQHESQSSQSSSLSSPPSLLLSLDLEEEGDYMYKVSHELVMECLLGLSTPAGFSEVTMQVPGVIEGTFFSNSNNEETSTSSTGMMIMGEELRAVHVKLDTSILAAMVEKSCRMVVRASVEALAAAASSASSLSSSSSTSLVVKEEEEASSSPPSHPPLEPYTTTYSTAIDIASPTPFSFGSPTVSEGDVRSSALVTPRMLFSDDSSPSPDMMMMMSSPKRMLFPIPDDFDDSSSNNNNNTNGPRRISPQPHPVFHHPNHQQQPLVVMPRTPMPGSSSTTTTTSCESTNSSSFAMMPRHYHQQYHPPLVSPPPANEASIRYNNKINKKGPSLPILVEVACRVLDN